jgi:hypothetical protein
MQCLWRATAGDDLVDKYLASRCRQDLPSDELQLTVGQLRSELTIWRENDSRLHSASFLVADAAAPSKGLSTVADAGMGALDALLKDERLTEATKKQQLGLIDAVATEAFSKQLILTPATGVKKLVEAASSNAGCQAVGSSIN